MTGTLYKEPMRKACTYHMTRGRVTPTYVLLRANPFPPHFWPLPLNPPGPENTLLFNGQHTGRSYSSDELLPQGHKTPPTLVSQRGLNREVGVAQQEWMGGAL